MYVIVIWIRMIFAKLSFIYIIYVDTFLVFIYLVSALLVRAVRIIAYDSPSHYLFRWFCAVNEHIVFHRDISGHRPSLFRVAFIANDRGDARARGNNNYFHPKKG